MKCVDFLPTGFALAKPTPANLPGRRSYDKKGTGRSRRPFFVMCESDDGYCFFAAHLLVAASHTPPAFVQSASVLAAVGSPPPAKAGPVKANARARASIETR